nr:HAD family hydrolase [Saccharibacillus qingshengii]
MFDLDGTLLDREKSLRAFLDDQYTRIPAMHTLPRQRFMERFIELDRNGYVWKDAVYRQLIEETGWPLHTEELLEGYVSGFGAHCIGFANLMDMLGKAKSLNLKLGIVSNGFTAFQQSNIEGLGIADKVDTILISEAEGLRKPDPALFRRALERLGLDPGETAFVGDHPVNDIGAAVEIGMVGLWKKNDVYEPPACRHVPIEDLIDIARWAAKQTGSQRSDQG